MYPRKRHLTRLLAGVLLLTAALVSGCRSSPPNVILVVVDTLRADRLGAYGNTRGLTPFLDELATRGTVFRQAYSVTSWTCPAVASLFTSRYPSQHHVSAFESVVADEELTLAEALRRVNYTTAGFSANFRLSQELGYAQGFQTWKALYVPGKTRAERVRAAVQGWLGGTHEPPTFLYLQYMETHAPYEPREPFVTRFQIGTADADMRKSVNDKLVGFKEAELTADQVTLLQSLYDGEVASVDAELRKLFGDLQEKGLLQDAVIVITADHGEEFREHGRMLHGRALFNETVKVPLIVVAPGYEGGRVVDENVSLLDVAPTVLNLAGVPIPATFEGRSLVPLLRRAGVLGSVDDWWRRLTGGGTADVILELPSFGTKFDLRAHTDGLVHQSTKLLLAPGGTASVYDLTADPTETAPNPSTLNGAKREMIVALARRHGDSATRASAAAESKPLDDATKDRLKALGYKDF